MATLLPPPDLYPSFKSSTCSGVGVGGLGFFDLNDGEDDLYWSSTVTAAPKKNDEGLGKKYNPNVGMDGSLVYSTRRLPLPSLLPQQQQRSNNIIPLPPTTPPRSASSATTSFTVESNPLESPTYATTNPNMHYATPVPSFYPLPQPPPPRFQQQQQRNRMPMRNNPATTTGRQQHQQQITNVLDALSNLNLNFPLPPRPPQPHSQPHLHHPHPFVRPAQQYGQAPSGILTPLTSTRLPRLNTLTHPFYNDSPLPHHLLLPRAQLLDLFTASTTSPSGPSNTYPGCLLDRKIYPSKPGKYTENLRGWILEGYWVDPTGTRFLKNGGSGSGTGGRVVNVRRDAGPGGEIWMYWPEEIRLPLPEQCQPTLHSHLLSHIRSGKIVYSSLAGRIYWSPNPTSSSTSSTSPSTASATRKVLCSNVPPTLKTEEDLIKYISQNLPQIRNTGNAGQVEAQPLDWFCGICGHMNWRRRSVCQLCYPFAPGNEPVDGKSVEVDAVLSLARQHHLHTTNTNIGLTRPMECCAKVGGMHISPLAMEVIRAKEKREEMKVAERMDEVMRWVWGAGAGLVGGLKVPPPTLAINTNLTPSITSGSSSSLALPTTATTTTTGVWGMEGLLPRTPTTSNSSSSVSSASSSPRVPEHIAVSSRVDLAPARMDVHFERAPGAGVRRTSPSATTNFGGARLF